MSSYIDGVAKKMIANRAGAAEARAVKYGGIKARETRRFRGLGLRLASSNHTLHNLIETWPSGLVEMRSQEFLF